MELSAASTSQAGVSGFLQIGAFLPVHFRPWLFRARWSWGFRRESWPPMIEEEEEEEEEEERSGPL